MSETGGRYKHTSHVCHAPVHL